MDRFDIHIEILRDDDDQLTSDRLGEPSAPIEAPHVAEAIQYWPRQML